jgi:hypothetical protein
MFVDVSNSAVKVRGGNRRRLRRFGGDRDSHGCFERAQPSTHPLSGVFGCQPSPDAERAQVRQRVLYGLKGAYGLIELSP